MIRSRRAFHFSLRWGASLGALGGMLGGMGKERSPLLCTIPKV